MFCRDGKNILLAPKEVEKVCKSAEFIPVKKKLVARLSPVEVWRFTGLPFKDFPFKTLKGDLTNFFSSSQIRKESRGA